MARAAEAGHSQKDAREYLVGAIRRREKSNGPGTIGADSMKDRLRKRRRSNVIPARYKVQIDLSKYDPDGWPKDHTPPPCRGTFRRNAKTGTLYRDRTFIGVWENGRTVIVAEIPTEE
jgi:hypothetical protein